MRNAVITIVGQKGSGKTTFAKILAAMAKRIVIVDRLFEYEDGEIFTNYERSLEHIARHWRGEFRTVIRYTQDEHWTLFFDFLAKLAHKCPALPVSLLVEEADFFASPHAIEPTLDYLYRYGRHFRINLISVARGDTDLHRSMIQNSDAFVVFRCRRFSHEMRQRFTAEDLQTIRGLDTLTPGAEPKQGKHYLVNPDDAKVSAIWKSAQT